MPMFKGSITVFFSLIFTVVLALICTVTESARMYAAGVRAYSATCIAIESEFAGYSKEVFDEYGVLLLWEKGLEKNVKNTVKVNIGQDATEDFDVSNLSVNSVKEEKVTYVTDDGGDEFVQQILDYTKYVAAGDVATELIEYLKKYNANIERDVDKTNDDVDETNTETDVLGGEITLSDEEIKCLQEITDRYNKYIKELKDADSGYADFVSGIQEISNESDSKQSEYSKNEVKKFRKIFKNLNKKINKYENRIEIVLGTSEEYVNKKKEILSNNQALSNGELSDYIEEDNTALKQMANSLKDLKDNLLKNSIKDIKETSTLSKEVFDKAYYGPIKESLENMESTVSEFVIKEATESDKDNINVFKEAKRLLETGILELVLPENANVSEKGISTEDIPSEKIEKSKQNLLGNMVNKALFVYYVTDQFSCCTDYEEKGALNYHLEYILQGNRSDKENLKETITELSVIRQIFNTVYVMSDKEEMTQYETLAASISIGFGVPFIQPVIKGVLIEAAALKETVSDIKVLLKGEKVNLLKGQMQSDNIAFSYENYLQIMLLLHNNEKMVYRTMDIMQVEINRKYNSSFRMAECITSAKIKADYQTTGVFTTLPVVKSVLNKSDIMGTFSVDVGYSYTK